MKQYTRKVTETKTGVTVEWTENQGDSFSEAIEAGHFKDESEILTSAYKDRRVTIQDNQRRAIRRDPKGATPEAMTELADKFQVGVIQRGPVSKGTVDAAEAGLNKKQVAILRGQGFTVINAPGESE